MRKLFYILVCLLTSFVVASCGTKGEQDSAEGTDKTSDTLNRDTTQHRISKYSAEAILVKFDEHDSIIKAQRYTIGVLEKKVKTLENENKSLKVDVDKIRKEKPIWTSVSIIAFALGLFALFIAWKSKCRLSRVEIEEIVNNRVKSEIKTIEIQRSPQVEPSKRNNTAISENNVLQRLVSLEGRVKKIEAGSKKEEEEGTKRVQMPINKQIPKETPGNLKEKYAKIGSDVYFVDQDLCSSNQEGCVFKITFTNETKGEFTLLGLQKIQSSNVWQKKIVVEAGVSIKDASDFEVVENGICERTNDGKAWKVTKQLKIKLVR